MTCGTPAGYVAHIRAGQAACEACVQAQYAANRARYHNDPAARARARRRSAASSRARVRLRLAYLSEYDALYAEERDLIGGTRKIDYARARNRALTRLRERHPDHYRTMYDQQLQEQTNE